MLNRLQHITISEIVIGAIAAYVLWRIVRWLYHCTRAFRAYRDMKRYDAMRQEEFNHAPPAPTDNRNEYTAGTILQDQIKDEDVRVQQMAEPKGFWSKLVMGENMGMIREMIRIANSSEHRGYWQDRVTAQKNIETGRSIRDEGQGR